MKKTKLIALSLFICIILVGAGYAAWTDKIGVEGTVKTGDLNVEFVNDELFPFIKDNDSYNMDYVNSSITQVNSQRLRINISNMYPGSMTYIGSKIKNTGSIPAVFDNINIDFDIMTDDELKRSLSVAGNLLKINSKGTITNLGSFISNPYELENNLTNILKDITLDPNDIVTFDYPKDKLVLDKIMSETCSNNFMDSNSMMFYLPMSVNNSLENTKIQFDISIDFKQQNQ